MSSQLTFSGSAAEMLKQYGKEVPEQKPQSGLEESMAAKKKMDAEKTCHDPDCTEDHSHGSHGHEHSHEQHSHEHSHGHSPGHPKCGEPGCCPENPPSDDGGAHAHERGRERGGHSHGGEPEHAIAAKLRAALEASHVRVVDESDGCGAKLKIVVVSGQFEGKGLLAQHRLVNNAVADELKHVHAFNLKTYTPTKWAKAQQL